MAVIFPKDGQFQKILVLSLMGLLFNREELLYTTLRQLFQDQ